MKSTRTAAKKATATSKEPVGLKPLPIPRLRPLSAEKLVEFQERFRPRPGAPGVDAVATLIRLRRGEA